MATDDLSNRLISPIKEEATQKSNASHTSLSQNGSFLKSQTYSQCDAAGSSLHSYSEIYESATRESIDETHDAARS